MITAIHRRIHPEKHPDKEREDKRIFLPDSGESSFAGGKRSRRRFLKLAMAGGASACLLSSAAFPMGHTATRHDPMTTSKSPQNEANPVRLADGSLIVYYMERNSHVASIRSSDDGLTWSEPQDEFSVSGETGYACRSLLDRNGEIHIWFVQRGEEHPRLPGNRHLDIWHSHTLDERRAWAEPRLIWQGYCGAIRGALQMENGRIIVPFGAWKTGNEELPDNTGSNYTTVIFSDDGGATWQQSSAALTSPVYEGYNGNNYGACEPCIARLSDGRLWMLIRTQTGFLYESFSRDGVNWTPTTSSRFNSSNSPAAFVDLDDNRTVVFWNNHELPPRVNGEGVYGGRDGLHAAITDDNGQTWYGFREVYLDPTRNESPPRSGDRGTAYPNGEATADGHILLVTGQGPHARAIIRFHPDWLYETRRQHEFTADGLENWCVYKSIGPAQNWWRDRIAGAQLIAHPDKTGDRVLHIRRPNEHDADGATWNFPSGQRGTLTLRLRVNRGFDGAQISLADRLFDPTDDQGEHLSIFQLPISPGGRIDGQAMLAPDLWHEFMLQWDVEKESCDVTIDGRPATCLALANQTVNGISYLRLRSTARGIDQAGILVEAVDVEVEPPG